jgi:predicted nucleic acid-binding protein
MKLAFDTNAYRALNDGNQRLADLQQQAAHVALPLIVVGELYFSIYLGSKHDENLSALQNFLATPRVEVLYPDNATAKLFGEISAELRRKGKPTQQNDVWIAALCKQHDYALATTDIGFDNITGLEIFRF